MALIIILNGEGKNPQPLQRDCDIDLEFYYVDLNSM